MLDSWLPDAFDQHADHVYVYCRFLLREPGDGADAVERTFLTAATRMRDLPAPELTLAWLFAIARNECLRAIRSGKPAPSATMSRSKPAQAGDGDLSPALMRAAIRRLPPAEGNVIGMFWHGLDVPEIARILGINRYDALTLFSRARDQLETSVTALLFAGDSHQPAQLSAVQLSLTPGALLSAAITAEGLRYASRVTSTIRPQLLNQADEAILPNPAAGRRSGAWPGEFRADGFPKPLSAGAKRKPRRAGLVAAGTAAAVAALALTVLEVSGGGPGPGAGPGAQARQTGGAASLIVPSLVASAAVSPTSKSPAPSRSASPSASASASASPSPSATRTSPAASPPAKQKTASPAPSAAPGKLLASPTTVTVSRWNPGSLTLSAAGGTVSWSITSSSRRLNVSQTSGTLQSGQSVTITVSDTEWSFSGGTLTVTGGGRTQQVQVTVNGG